MLPAMEEATAHRALRASDRVLATDAPVIVKTKRLMAGHDNVLSLAQGIVHWQPPPQALQVAAKQLASGDPSVHGYGPAEGLPALREALRSKVADRNSLLGYDVMVTAGANQAFVNLVLGLTDADDPVVLLRPYYFNHLMALQMTGGARSVELGPCHPDSLHPDLDWLEARCKSAPPPRMVVMVNPCNPTGVLLSAQEVQRAADICAAAGTWLVLDNTYEDFLFEGRRHTCPAGPHVLHVFSMSKAYGMMGWRVGYIAYPGSDGFDGLGAQLLKVQDTIPICPSTLSQHVALAALRDGGDYVQQQVAHLIDNRAAIREALAPLAEAGGVVAGGEGGIYFWAQLPPSCQDDEAAVAWLVREAGVCVIPGSACGAPGFIRVAYANLRPGQCAEAAARLRRGLVWLVEQGGAALGGGSASACTDAAAGAPASSALDA